MGLEKIVVLPGEESKKFDILSSAYLLTGFVDGLLTIKGLNSGINADLDLNPLINSIVDYYGIENSITLTKLNSLIAIMIGGIAERSDISVFYKKLMRKALYAGIAFSGLGIMGWLSTLYRLSK